MANGADVVMQPIAKDAEADAFDAVVLGSAIWLEKPLPEASRYLRDHRDSLAKRPVA